jgi:hypothetical protein
VTLRIDGVAAATAATSGGHVAFGRAGRLRAAWHRLTVSLDGGWSDGVDVWGGDRMTRRLARRLLRRSGLDGRGEGEDAWRVGRRCRVFVRRERRSPAQRDPGHAGLPVWQSPAGGLPREAGLAPAPRDDADLGCAE